VKNLIFPLWNPYYYNGHPLFATLQPAVLYPFSALYFLLPFNWAFNLNIEIHYALAGWFTYLLARGMNASQTGSLIAGLSFMLSGYLLSVHNTLSMLLSVTWVPLFFLCYFSSIKNNNLGHAILSGVVGTAMFLGGGIETCYLAFGVAFFLTLFPALALGLTEFINLPRRLMFFVLFCLIFFGLSSVQLIPFLELSYMSLRAEGLPYFEAGTWSLHPYDLIEFFIPDQYGLATDFKKYWNYQNWLKTIYMGGLPFILAAFCLRKWDRRVQGLLLVFVIALGLAMGKNTLFHPFLYEYLPFFNKLRFPVKFIFLAVLIVSVAAGLGYDTLKKEKRNPESPKWARYILSLGFFFMILFGLFNFFNDALVTYFKAVGWDHPKYNEIKVNLFNIKRFLAFTSLYCLGLFLYSKPKFNKPYVIGAIISLFILDLFFANFNFYQKENFNKVMQMGENAKFIKSDPGLFRIFVTPKSKKGKIAVSGAMEGLDIRKEKFLTGLLGNIRILDVEGIGVTQQGRKKKMMGLILTAPKFDSTNLLNLMNVKYIVSVHPMTSTNFEWVHSYEPIPKDPEQRKRLEDIPLFKIYKNKKVLPHAFLVPQCKVINNDQQYKDILQSKKFNPERILLLDAEPKDFPCDGKEVSGKTGPVIINSYKSNTIELSVHSKQRQFLFMSDSYYPGWKVYINDKPAEILRANYLFRAVVVEPGKSRVRFEYDPLSFKLGLAISLLTILLCGIYFFKTKRNKRLQTVISI
jgi:hypothetical protein